MLKLITVMFTVASLAACSATHLPVREKRPLENKCDRRIDVEKTLINYDFKPITSRMTKNFCDPISQYNLDSILVLDGVNQKTMMGSELGKVIGSHIKERVVNLCNIPVKKITLSKYFRLSNNGVTATSFDLAKVNEVNFSAPIVMVPSYSSESNSIRIHIELVDLSTQSTITSTNKLISWQCRDSSQKAILDIKEEI